MKLLLTIISAIRRMFTPPTEGLPEDVARWLRLIGGIAHVYSIIDNAAKVATSDAGKRQAALAELRRAVQLRTGFLLPDSIARLILEWAICLRKGPRPPK